MSVIDVYSRKILDWLFQGSIRQIDLINLFRRISQSHELKEIKQEFTHVATPEENSYIKAFHSILEHDVIKRNVFDSYYEAKEMLGRYFSHYNYHRLHRSIGFITPQQKWEEAQVIYDTIFSENLSS